MEIQYFIIYICRKIDNKVIQVEGEIYWEIDTIAIRFYWTIIRTTRGGINEGKNLYNKEKVFLIIQISPRFLHFAFLNIHRWLNINNITPHGPDDDSVEPKRNSVNLSPSSEITLLSIFLYIVRLQSFIYFIYIYIYIYIYSVVKKW